MVIDIISYTPAQLAMLSEEQILKVEAAQLKKNRLYEELKKNKIKARLKLLKTGMFSSTMRDSLQSELQTEYNAEVENIRNGLLFYLQYSAKPNDVQEAPYTVDYSLELDERLEIVRSYYEGAYSDPGARADAYKNDSVALQYLGEYYSPLYEYFLSLK